MKRIAPVVLTVLLALLLAACAPQSSGSGDDGLHSIVPDVVGMDEAAARGELEGAGYVVGDVTTEESDMADPGTVISQDPIATTSAPRESEVDLVVAAP